MNKTTKLALVTLFVMSIITIVAPAYSQDAAAPAVEAVPVVVEAAPVAVEPVVAQPAEEITGTISAMDAEKSTITINTAVENAEPLTVEVVAETPITKGEAAVTLADLKVGDKITVTSSIDAAGIKKVTGIKVIVE
jgi:hypothetical protein